MKKSEFKRSYLSSPKEQYQCQQEHSWRLDHPCKSRVSTLFAICVRCHYGFGQRSDITGVLTLLTRRPYLYIFQCMHLNIPPLLECGLLGKLLPSQSTPHHRWSWRTANAEEHGNILSSLSSAFWWLVKMFDRVFEEENRLNRSIMISTLKLLKERHRTHMYYHVSDLRSLRSTLGSMYPFRVHFLVVLPHWRKSNCGEVLSKAITTICRPISFDWEYEEWHHNWDGWLLLSASKNNHLAFCPAFNFRWASFQSSTPFFKVSSLTSSNMFTPKRIGKLYLWCRSNAVILSKTSFGSSKSESVSIHSVHDMK